jgi:hypothetical protein
MIRFSCPVCGAPVEYPTPGHKLPCPGCGQRLQVPAPTSKTVLGVVPAARVPAPPPTPALVADVEEVPDGGPRPPPRRRKAAGWTCGQVAAGLLALLVLLAVAGLAGYATGRLRRPGSAASQAEATARQQPATTAEPVAAGGKAPAKAPKAKGEGLAAAEAGPDGFAECDGLHIAVAAVLTVEAGTFKTTVLLFAENRSKDKAVWLTRSADDAPDYYPARVLDGAGVNRVHRHWIADLRFFHPARRHARKGIGPGACDMQFVEIGTPSDAVKRLEVFAPSWVAGSRHEARFAVRLGAEDAKDARVPTAAVINPMLLNQRIVFRYRHPGYEKFMRRCFPDAR